MPIKYTITVKPTNESTSETFEIDAWPTSGAEALKMWGDNVVLNSINGTSAHIQAAGIYRGLRRKMTAKEAAKNMAAFKPSDGTRTRVSTGDKVAKLAADLTPAERYAFLVSQGVDKDMASGITGFTSDA